MMSKAESRETARWERTWDYLTGDDAWAAKYLKVTLSEYHEIMGPGNSGMPGKFRECDARASRFEYAPARSLELMALKVRHVAKIKGLI